MKRVLLFIFLVLLSVASGLHLSRATWIGKVGITFFHKAYNLTKIWWQGALAVFIILLVFYFLHSLVQRLPTAVAKMGHLLLLLCACAVLYLTYDDFHTDFTHKLLGRKFHYGVYLIWLGWIVIAIYFLFSRTRKIKDIISADKTEPAVR